MKVSIFGIGYVGAVTAGCLSSRGHTVTCVDVNQDKVDGINQGRSPIVEPGLNDILKQAVDDGLLSATTDCDSAVQETDISIVCVGTPSTESGRLNLSFARQVYQQIADAVAEKQSKHLVIVRSTMLPGSVRNLAEGYRPELVRDGMLSVCFCPEFLREGTAIADYQTPALAVYGDVDDMDRPALETLMGKCERIPLESAELIKYACNYWHAVKVGFGNEIGRLSKHLDIDGQHLMRLFCQDNILNISPYYLRPGNPFGGSCLPKDVSALGAFTRQEGIPMPLLESVLPTNQAHLDHLLKLVTTVATDSVLIVGLSFKKSTDDLRGSPMVAVAETLLGKGFGVEIYDTNLDMSTLTGSNETEIHRRLPHLASRLISDIKKGLARHKTLVIAQDVIDFETLRLHLTENHSIIDTVGIQPLVSMPGNYHGICWTERSERSE
ncbi:GDP-mannose 6-dehydrogenase [Rhodopirellula sallentina SM41]|uniref:UDP-glucose 6-dehydrogenase n=1 Tax=Rhodopirellula sallentina SM41 TaxID=1263870 RepID=M5TSU4_9BACT|nr:GDP-mannose 6-dehydrogenase [Rhodopirellula sallentina SM41]